MCGIAGYLTKTGHEKTAGVIHNMLARLVRRGPDGTSWLGLTPDGSFLWQTQDQFNPEQRFRLAFGCSRLAIQDPTERGLQPIQSQNEQCWVALNGEIFNFPELREEFKARGYQFKTQTDTEIIAACYQFYGTACFEKFNGQFAIAIYDLKSQKFILARDRVGITPLYLLRQQNTIAFASEVKALWEAQDGQLGLNEKQIAALIGLPYKLHWLPGSTLFKDVEAVKPGSFIEIDLVSHEMKRQLFWDIRSVEPVQYKSFREAKEHVKSLLIDSVKIRMRSDRQLAFIVSGGVDSSSILGIANRVFGIDPRTFSLDIPNVRFNEKTEIEEVDYNNVSHNFISVTEQKVIDLFPEVVAASDEPLATPNAILHGIMSREIDEAGIKVVLNGVGGDESFFGYHDHFLFSLAEAQKNDPSRFKREYQSWLSNQKRDPEVFNQFMTFLNSNTRDYSPDFLARSRGFDYRTVLKTPFHEGLSDWSFSLLDATPRGKQIDDLTRLTVPHSIRMDDNCYLSMAVEARQPFLDHRLIEAGTTMPTDYKIRNSVSKFILRQAVKDFIPAARRLDQRKVGLNFPIDDWFRDGLRPWVKDQLDNRSSPLYDFAEYSSVQKILEQHDHQEANHCLKIWDLLCLNDWLKRYR